MIEAFQHRSGLGRHRADDIGVGTPLRSELSDPEADIWALQRRMPDSACCWIAEYLEILGPIDAALFETALHDVVASIPALHAVFEERDGIPCRMAAPARPSAHPWRLRTEDLASEPDPEGAAKARMRDLVSCAPGLDTYPLFGFALFRIGPARWMWFQSYHHIVMDGAGLHQVASLLADRYSARLGRDPNLPALAVRALPAATPKSEDAIAASELHWGALLQGWDQPLRFAGRTAPPAPLSRSVPVPMTNLVTTRLRRAGRAAGLPLAHVMMAATALWLNATSGRADVVFGLAVRDRDRTPGVPRVPTGPAMASNVVPIRVELSPHSTLVALAGAIARQRRASRGYDRLRGSRILRLAPQPDAPSFGPVVNVMALDYGFAFGGHPCQGHNISIGPVDDICLCIYDRNDGQGVVLRLNGNPVLHSEAALAAHAQRLARVLVQLAHTPDRPAAALDVLGAAERRLLLETWNDTARPVPPVGFAGMVLDQAVCRPGAPFLRQGDATFDYCTAIAAAKSLADALREQATRPAAVVAILLPRSPEFFVAVLGVALHGAAFVPIDPSNPPARLAAMLEDAGAACVVTTASPIAGLAIQAGVAVVRIDTMRERDGTGLTSGACGRPTASPPPFHGNDLAYVIFTSGTTGRPKAVAVPQRGIASLARFQAHHLRLEPESRILQFASVGFDAVLMELLMAIAVGGCLFLPDDDQRHGAALGTFLTQNAITHALLPPAALLGLDATTQTHPATLVVGGEACPRPLAQAWSVGRRMINAYGPTEATICATMSDPLTGDAPPPIGRPIWNTRVHVLDDFGRPLPVGIEGELCIAGAGVADGYIGEQAASGLRFVACPFAPGGRMVRTGDRARFDANGVLSCFGRADRQLKIRGVRIEPAEIEAALCSLAGVLQAVIVAEGNGDLEVRTRLIAYVVHQAGAAARPEAIRAAAATVLPPAMLPALVIVIERIPLTRHGKVDLLALPPPPAASLGDAPATVGERQLAALFAEALGRDQVGMDDDFFALGGDSLAATQLIHRVNLAMGSNLTLADVFEAPGLAALARRAADRGAPRASPFAPMLGFRIGASRPALFCIHVGSGIGWAYSALLRHLDPAQPVYAIQARGLDGRAALPESLDAIADDYADAIRRAQPAGPYHLLGWSSGGPLAHRVAIRLQSLGCEIGLLASLDGYPAGPHYAAGVPPPHAFETARADLRRAIELYLDADSSHGMAREDIIDDAVLGRMIGIHVNTGVLLATGQSGRFAGNLLLFTCSEPYRPLPMPPPSAWTPHVTGAVDVVEIPGHHDMMLMPASAAIIGRTIAARLQAN